MGEGPGPLIMASLCYHNQRLLLYGGRNSLQEISAALWTFDLQKEQWQRVATVGTRPPPLWCHTGEQRCALKLPDYFIAQVNRIFAGVFETFHKQHTQRYLQSMVYELLWMDCLVWLTLSHQMRSVMCTVS